MSPVQRGTTASRARERDEQLTRIQEQVEAGQLTIRQATPDEMRRFAAEAEAARARGTTRRFNYAEAS